MGPPTVYLMGPPALPLTQHTYLKECSFVFKEDRKKHCCSIRGDGGSWCLVGRGGGPGAWWGVVGDPGALWGEVGGPGAWWGEMRALVLSREI